MFVRIVVPQLLKRGSINPALPVNTMVGPTNDGKLMGVAEAHNIWRY